jgi:hypothetical protein
LTVDEKLKYLEELEISIKEDTKHSLAAFRRKGSNRRQQSRSRSYSESESDVDLIHSKCHLCKREGHFVANCHKLDLASNLLRAHLREQRNSRAKAGDSKEKKPRSKKLTPSTTSSSKTKKPSPKKNHGYSANINSDSEIDDNSSESSAESEDDDIEVAALSKEQICKAIPSEWPADTGASSHMSDQPNLFRNLEPIKRRTVKVGGGVLYANHRGTANMVCPDGSSMLLADCLYVPDLGVNLMSARRLCEGGLKGAFNDKKMYFKNGNKTIVRATMREGLYIVTNVASGYEEKAFAGVINKDLETGEDSEAQENPKAPQSTEELSRAEQERYILWHRRFSHLGPKKIRNLHKISTLAKPIKVPTNREPCKVCALTKMKNKIPKELSPHKQSRLALIQFDVAGPLPKSLRGNRYFLLIIDSYSRKNWVIPLKLKSDAGKELRKWIIWAENQTGDKVKAARTDNAPELLKVAQEWNEFKGVEVQPTTIASSHQNGAAEKNIQTTEDNVRALVKDSGLPLEFWDKAAEFDAHIRNRTDTRPMIEGSVVSPEEA